MSTSFEPLMENRFIIEFPSNFYIPPYLIAKFGRPKCLIINNKLIWDDLEIEILQPLLLNISTRILNNLNNLSNYNILIKQHLLSPLGDIVESWNIYTELISIDFGNLDWSSEDLSIIKIKLKINAISNRTNK